MCSSCDNRSSSSSSYSRPVSNGQKLSNFLSTGSTEGRSTQFQWRSFGAVSTALGGQDAVLAALKENPEGFQVRLGRHGDLYIALA